MRIVDKYGLAKEPYGTIFYCLDKYGHLGSELKVLISRTFYSSDNKPMFNGVLYLAPDIIDDSGNSSCDDLTVGRTIPFDSLLSIDEDSNDYDDCDRFLVLEKEEALDMLDCITAKVKFSTMIDRSKLREVHNNEEK